MLSYKEIEVPDANEFRNVSVVDILVKEGERVEVETPLITVQSGGGTVDMPSPLAGRVQEVIVQIDDRISKGTSILLLETEIEDPDSEPARNEVPARDFSNDFDPFASEEWGTTPEVLEPDSSAAETTASAAEAEATAAESTQLFEEPVVDTPAQSGGSDTPRSGYGITITVPDIGDFEEVEVIEVHIKAGDRIEMEDSLITLESDKATMDVPSPVAGTIEKVLVAVGSKVKQGTAIANLDPASGELRDSPEPTAEHAAEPEPPTAETPLSETPPPEPPAAHPVKEDAQSAPPADLNPGKDKDPVEGSVINVPDIGDFEDIEVIEVHIEAGQLVATEDPLITLESDKATMDVPSPLAGKIQEVFIATGDRVSEGSPIASISPDSKEESEEPDRIPAAQPATRIQEPEPELPKSDPLQAPTGVAAAVPPPPPTLPAAVQPSSDDNPHASPGVRRFARELGADLTRISGSGPKDRILKTDVQQWIKKALTEPVERAPAAPAGSGIPEIPEIDFTQFGDVETRPLSRIKKLTATNLSRAWLNVPHVTQHDEADITELEEFRKQLKDEAVAKGEARITMLSFLMKACVVALKEFPAFNSSLQKGGQNLILKKYYHLGIAVDTEEGLVVPVAKDVDRKSIRDLAAELGDLSKRARDKKLSPKDLQGASFTISSLGGLGGSAFTPIVNAPEVAILGVSRSSMKPVYEDGEFVPRLILPLSLSYDHRVIDGAQAARFTTFLAKVLQDVRRLLL